MLDFWETLIQIFGKFVYMLFELPFYGNVTYGFLLLAIYIAVLIFGFVIGRMK